MTNDRLDVSVVLCTYNRARLLTQALAHVGAAAKRSNARVEIIVVDNNSRDDTKSVVAAASRASLVPVRYVLETRQGLSFARNRGIQECQANARSSMRPPWIAALGLRILESPRLCWIAGLGTALNLGALDGVARADELRLPALVIHSEWDRSTPFAVSRRFVSRRRDLATLVTFPSVEHTQEWNIDPEGWDAAVFAWLRNRVPSG